MGLQDREYYRDDRTDEFRLETMSVIVKIIVATIGVFLFDLVFGQSRFLIQNEFLSCSRETLLQPWKCWQLLTSGFAHANVGHLFFNMVSLYFFGRELEYHVGKRELATFYLVAIVVGSLTFCIKQLFDGGSGSALGASGAVMAVIILFCLKFPLVPILRFPFEIPAWMAGVFYVLSDIAGLASPGSEIIGPRVGYEIHLAGAAFALVYWYFGCHFSSVFDTDLVVKIKRWFRRRRGPALRVHQPAEFDTRLEAEADRLLAQVGEKGMDSLTAKERKTLEDYSRQVRNRRP